MSWLWEADALVAATGGRPLGSLPDGVTGLSIDSRTLQSGEAFFAIKGEAFDGHDFATAAIRAGAGLLVVSEQKLPALGHVQAPLLVVDDVLKALERLASASRARSKAQIVAITGSVGKTTTKEALRHALAACGSVHASAASFNNHWGVPLSLARMPADCRFGVFELGMNHPNEIRPLVKLVRPHVAVVTLIAAAHLGFFRDLDEIADAKAEIFEGVLPGGAAVLNRDDERTGRLAESARRAGIERILTFGEGEGADFRLLGFESAGEGARLSALIAGKRIELALGSAGRHIAQNVLAVLGAAKLMGAEVAVCAKALEGWRPGKGRGERHELSAPDNGRIVLIDDSYNANPASMRAALQLLKATPPDGSGRRIAVLGDMLELGEHSARLHAELAEPLLEAGVARVFLAGDQMKALDEALAGRIDCSWHPSASELGASLLGDIRAGDVVSVKASNGIGFARVVEQLVKARGPEPAEASAGTASNPAPEA